MKFFTFLLLTLFISCGVEDLPTNSDKNSSKSKIDLSNKTFIISDDLDSLQKIEKFPFPPKHLSQFDFSPMEEKVSDSFKLEFLQKLVFNQYLLPAKFETTEDYDFENYHILDFNGDSKLDVIYDGRNPPGIETNNVVFFINQGDSLVPIIKFNGDFTKIEMKNHKLRSFQLIKTPCCANFLYRIEDYVLKENIDCFKPYNGIHEYYQYSYGQINSIDFCVSLSHRFAYVQGTVFPSKIITVRKAKTIKKAFVTPKPAPPSSTDFKESGVYFTHSSNKAISELPIGTECLILYEKTNENGRGHCFIAFINAIKRNNYVPENKYVQYGWIDKNSLN